MNSTRCSGMRCWMDGWMDFLLGDIWRRPLSPLLLVDAVNPFLWILCCRLTAGWFISARQTNHDPAHRQSLSDFLLRVPIWYSGVNWPFWVQASHIEKSQQSKINLISMLQTWLTSLLLISILRLCKKQNLNLFQKFIKYWLQKEIDKKELTYSLCVEHHGKKIDHYVVLRSKCCL